MFLVLDNETGEHDFSLKPMNCPSHHLYLRLQEAQLPRSAAAPAHPGRAPPQRGRGLARRPHPRAPVRPGRRAHLLHARSQIADEVQQLRAAAGPRLQRGRPEVRRRSSPRAPSSASATTRMWDRAEARARGRARSARACPTRSSPATAPSTARRSTSTCPTASAASGSWAPSSSTTGAPERFDLTYIGEDNAEHRPVVLHRAIFGSFERFIAILIEHFAGAFPTWLAPVQASIVTVADRQLDYAREVQRPAARQGLPRGAGRARADAQREDPRGPDPQDSLHPGHRRQRGGGGRRGPPAGTAARTSRA